VIEGDEGRTAAYAAEDAAFGGTPLDDELPFGDLVAVARGVTTGAWWRAAGGPEVEERPARAGTTSSSARGRGPGAVEVRLAAGQLTTTTVAHELAHALAGVAHGHDATFRRAHVDVCALLAGQGAGEALATAYAQLGAPAGDRTWPSPVRVIGDGFVVVP